MASPVRPVHRRARIRPAGMVRSRRSRHKDARHRVAAAGPPGRGAQGRTGGYRIRELRTMTEQPSTDNIAHRPAWTVRLATWSARHRWPVVGLWFLVTVGIFAISLSMGGTRTQGAVSQNAKARFESVRAYELFGASNTTIQEPVQAVYCVV